MEIVLPQDIAPLNDRPFEVLVLPYSTDKASTKTRIVLDSHLFSFLTEGEKTVSYASGTRRIDKESYFFLPYGNCLMSEKLASDGSYKSLLLFVSRKAMRSFFTAHSSKYDVARKAIDRLEVEPIAILKDDYIQHFISSLEITSSESNEDIWKLKFEELMIYMLQRNESLVGYFHSLCEEWDEDAQLRRIVSIHMESSVTVEELAFLCNMSLSTFKRKFARVFGDAPKQWFLKMRMERAAELLKKRGMKASEIFEELGYDNLSSFVQAFKKTYGLTPKQFQLAD